MKRILLLALSLQLFTILGYSQISFVEATGSTFDGVSDGDLAYTDYDNDGDFDLIVSGFNGTQRIVKLYSNDGNANFTLVTGTPFVGVRYSDIALGDVDNDGDEDVVITGEDDTVASLTNFYANNSGSFVLIPAVSFIDVKRGESVFGDVNGDGDLDLLVTGVGSTNIKQSVLYDNNGTVISAPFSAISNAVSFSSVEMLDVEADGDLDIMLTGNTNGGAVSRLYINNGSGVYTLSTGNSFEGVSFSDIDFADVDGDNDLDLLITGLTSSGVIAKLYLNDGSGLYSEDTTAGFIGVRASATEFADIDNDSDQDVLITGLTQGGSKFTRLYANDGNGNFTGLTTLPFDNVQNSSVAIADFNGDSKKDIIISGDNGTSFITKLYLNTSTLSTQGFENLTIGLYPNPVKKYFKIEADIQGLKDISIYNLQGKQVKFFPNILETYQVEDLVTGMYFVKINTTNGIITKKIIKY